MKNRTSVDTQYYMDVCPAISLTYLNTGYIAELLLLFFILKEHHKHIITT